VKIGSKQGLWTSEILLKKGYDGVKADIWSCGCILYVLLAGVMPFQDGNTNVLYDKIKTGDYKIPKHFSPEAVDLIKRILCVDPAKRITIDQIIKTPWFQVNYTNPVKEVDIDIKGINLDEEFEIVEETEGKEEPGLKRANAFDLIHMSGALDLSSLIKKKGKAKNEESSPVPNIRQTRFVSEKAPDLLFERIEKILQQYPDMGLKINKADYKILVTGRTPGGLLNMHVQIFILAPGLYLVDFRKGKGNALEYYKFHAKIQEQLKDLSAEEEDPLPPQNASKSLKKNRK